MQLLSYPEIGEDLEVKLLCGGVYQYPSAYQLNVGGLEPRVTPEETLQDLQQPHLAKTIWFQAAFTQTRLQLAGWNWLFDEGKLSSAKTRNLGKKPWAFGVALRDTLRASGYIHFFSVINWNKVDELLRSS